VVWNNEVPGAQFRLTKPGVISAKWLNSHNCPESDSINVNLFPNPKLNLGPDTILCLSEKPILDAGPGMQSYFWYNGVKDQMIVARDSGLYWVEVKDWEGCKSRDSVFINKRKDLFTSLIFMPNAFTPNEDGLNDLYPNNQYKVKGSLYNLKLYNRWGEKLADYSSPDVNWDGKINGVIAAEGVYVYKITWIGCDNYLRTQVGDFTLMR
jgi:gliding motility-associated-like protein